MYARIVPESQAKFADNISSGSPSDKVRKNSLTQKFMESMDDEEITQRGKR